MPPKTLPNILFLTAMAVLASAALLLPACGNNETEKTAPPVEQVEAVVQIEESAPAPDDPPWAHR